MSRPVHSDLDCGGKSRVRNLPAPLSGSDAVNRDYVDAAVLGNTPGFNSLESLTDVGTSEKIDGSILYYDGQQQKYVFDDITTKITLTDGGNF